MAGATELSAWQVFLPPSPPGAERSCHHKLQFMEVTEHSKAAHSMSKEIVEVS